MKVYDGTGMLLGRMASKIAKDLLLGEEIRVINCEKFLISGKKENTMARESARLKRKGYPLKSTKVSRQPYLFVRKSIRGMLPFKTARGREAFKRVLCYEGVPSELAQEKAIHLEFAAATKLPTMRMITIGEICNRMRGKV